MKNKGYDKQLRIMEYDIMNNSKVIANGPGIQTCVPGKMICPIDHMQCCTKEEYDEQLQYVSSSEQKQPLLKREVDVFKERSGGVMSNITAPITNIKSSISNPIKSVANDISKFNI